MLKQAKEAGVYVVKEEFVEASKKGGAALLIASHSLCDWGKDVSSLVYKILLIIVLAFSWSTIQTLHFYGQEWAPENWFA